MKKFAFLFSMICSFYLQCQNSGSKRDGSSLEIKIDSIVKVGIMEKAFPGAQVLIYKNKQIRLNKSYGFQTYDSLVRVEKHHLYDLASVTKILASTLAFMKLYELYGIDLDQKAADYIPLIKRSNKKLSTFRAILSHQAGWLPYIEHHMKVRRKNGKVKYRTLSSFKSSRYPTPIIDSLFIHRKYQKKIMRRIKKTPIENTGEYRYSGLWFFLLPELVKNLTGQSFEDFLENHFYKPMGIKRLTFNPIFVYPKKEIIPTEKDLFFRNKLVQGWVHDEAAAMMGGVSGNAGLFGNANAVSKILKMLMNKGKFEGNQYLKPKTVDLFTKRAYPVSQNRRGLGFDKPSLDTIPEKRYPSKKSSLKSFGHTGFTGTFVWVDPHHSCFVVFLSNRVYPTREQKKLYKLGIRGKILDIAIEED